MRELLDVLKTATPEERLEFSAWWAALPISSNVFYEPVTILPDLAVTTFRGLDEMESTLSTKEEKK